MKSLFTYAAIAGLSMVMAVPASAQEQRKLDLNLDGTTSLAKRLSDCGINGSQYNAYFWENGDWVFDGNLQINAASTKGGDTMLVGQLGGWNLSYRFNTCEKPSFDLGVANAALFGGRDNGVYMAIDNENNIYLLYQANDGSIGEYALEQLQ